MKKTPFTLTAGALLMLSLSAHAYEFTDQAQVTGVEPIYQQQQQRCWDEQVQSQGGNGGNNGSSLNAGTVIGGVAGALIANRVGEGNGKTAATALGAVTGAMIGNNMNNNGNNQGGTQTVRRCSNTSPQVSGYRVTYVYAGRQSTVQMQRNPGSSVRVGVGVVE